MVFSSADGDGGRGGRDGGAGGRGNRVERGSSSKQARKRISKCRRDIMHYGLVGCGLELELDAAFKDMLNELDEKIERMVAEYGRISDLSEEFPAAIKPLIKRTSQKHEAAIMGVMEEQKMRIKAILETKGAPAEEYQAAIQVMVDEFEVAVNKHLSKTYLLSLLCKAAAEQMTESVRRRLQG